MSAQVNVYVGNSPDWHENTLCPGGPFLDPDLKDYYDLKAEISGWPMSEAYGFEAWCNLEGRYVFWVADTVPT